jgi:glycosyltransferase involved in cell wall biosynthesis
MERVALEEVRRLAAKGYKVSLYANDVMGQEPNVFSLERMQNVTRWKEFLFILKFLRKSLTADILIGFYTPMLSLLAPKRSLVYFQGEAVFALSLERYQWAFNRYNKACYLFCSDYVRQRFIERHPRINKDHLFVLYNGVDAQEFSPSLKPRRHGPTRFSFHGRWVENKGVLVLLEAVKILEARRPDFECFIAGSPEVPYPTVESMRMGEKVSAVAKELKPVKFLGAITYDKLPAFIQDMDFGVVPSIDPEPFGIVNLEYMACGLPVVASKVGGIPEIFCNGEAGFLVEPNNPQELATAIERLLDSVELRTRMGIAARTIVEERFTWELHINRLVKICQLADRVSA